MTRFRRDGAPSKQKRGGRRGHVFSVRLTDEQRAQIELLRGNLSVGAWLVRRGTTPASGEVLPARAGTTAPGVVLPELRYYPLEPPAGEVLPGRGQRIILDLCAGSGAWSQPYQDRGYDVRPITLPGADVRDYMPEGPVWGVLAAPPCDQFSLARNGHPDLPRDFARGLEAVVACLRIIALARPRWWALENPAGMLSRWLGTPRDVFEPWHYGDPWTKRTALWGDFTLPRRGPAVDPIGHGGPLCVDCNDGRATCWRSDHRARTPEGFARAFCEANP